MVFTKNFLLPQHLNDAKDDKNKRKETEVYYLYMLAHLYTLNI